MSKDDNVEKAVPFFGVSNLESSLRAALMLQEFNEVHRPKTKVGEGVNICFTCKDALKIYRDARARGIEAKPPFVGNGLWVTSFSDPDGYRLDFESPTDEPEETEYTE